MMIMANDKSKNKIRYDDETFKGAILVFFPESPTQVIRTKQTNKLKHMYDTT